jgi:hypothetical protein
VSHHPPISASRCGGPGWTAGESVDIKATYMGNSIEISNSGPHASRFITLDATGDRYSWNLASAVVANLFIGGTFVDHHGTFEILNEATGAKSVITVTKCGWFSAGRYCVSGRLLTPAGDEAAAYAGRWNKYFDFERAEKLRGEGAMRLWVAGKHLLPEEDGGGAAGSLPRFTRFGAALLAMDDKARRALPPTDSRLRPDRLALQALDAVRASEEKGRVEQAQRDRTAKLAESGAEHAPRWFTPAVDGDRATWLSSGDYWAYAAALTDEDRARDSLW